MIRNAHQSSTTSSPAKGSTSHPPNHAIAAEMTNTGANINPSQIFLPRASSERFGRQSRKTALFSALSGVTLLAPERTDRLQPSRAFYRSATMRGKKRSLITRSELPFNFPDGSASARIDRHCLAGPMPPSDRPGRREWCTCPPPTRQGRSICIAPSKTAGKGCRYGIHALRRTAGTAPCFSTCQRLQ